jgi:ABC-type multidrug transport system fused ATPase/permease subunit
LPCRRRDKAAHGIIGIVRLPSSQPYFNGIQPLGQPLPNGGQVTVRLNSIKLSGFKSFAEPTNFLLPGQLVGVVGPNGCGKSNIMDAVRWVLGEARQ